MATIPYQSSLVTGLAALTFTACNGGGDKVLPNDRGVIVFKNGDAASKTISIDVPGTKYGQTYTDISLVVAAGATAVLGPFPADLANPADGLVQILYSAVTSCTIGALQF